jgi:hypothetical protein
MPSQEPVRSLLAELAAAGHTDSDAAVERCLLIQTARASLATLPALPVSESVKAMICDEVQSWTRLGQHEKAGFRVGTSRFVDLSLIASLRRFPAGQFDWVRSGLPLSYLLSVTPRELPRALFIAAVRLRGRAPVFFTHFGYRRFGQPLSETEANRSYYRMARSMELQPDVKGLVVPIAGHSSRQPSSGLGQYRGRRERGIRGGAGTRGSELWGLRAQPDAPASLRAR